MYSQRNLELGIWRSTTLMKDKEITAINKLIQRKDFSLLHLIGYCYKVFGEEEMNNIISLTLTDGHNIDLINNLKCKEE